jgi:hypothetical protein
MIAQRRFGVFDLLHRKNKMKENLRSCVLEVRYVLDEWGYLHFADWLVTYKISTINLTSIRYCPKIFTLI